jgi:DHA1 family chloramphenicol resistance protein-like MFS transporter
MPPVVYILGLAIFAQGTSELMIAGLLPQIAGGLHVSIPKAGLLISGFAVGMIIGAPSLTIATRRLPRRPVLLAFIAAFVAMHVIGALAPDYTVLLVSRMAAAFVYAGFWSVASASIVGLVPPDALGRALSVVVGGLTVATVIGLPAGTFLGERLGWRAAFWAVAVLSALTMPAIYLTTRSIGTGRPDIDLRAELRAMRSRPLLLAYLTTALATGALLVTYSYLSPLLTGVTHIGAGWVPGVLLLYGAGGFAGVTLGGRIADRRPDALLVTGLVGVVGVSVALALLAGSWEAMATVVFLLGAFGFGTNPALNTRVFARAGEARVLASGTNTSAFNVGIAVGPWLGGLAIGAGAGYRVLGWIGAALAVCAIATTVSTSPAGERPRGRWWRPWR